MTVAYLDTGPDEVPHASVLIRISAGFTALGLATCCWLPGRRLTTPDEAAADERTPELVGEA